MSVTRRLSGLTLITTLVLIGIGAFTRGSGSGYGCADRWPLCEGGLLGGLLPRAEYHMIVEWTHRWVAAIVGILAIATAVVAWRRLRRQTWIVWPAAAAVVVIGIQAWVGRSVVTNELDADLVSLHLAISMIALGLITVVFTATVPRPASADQHDRRIWFTLIAAGATGSYVLLLLGSYVHNLYIRGWPLVANSLLPDLSNRFVLVHFIHRLAAAAVFIYLGYLAYRSHRERRPERYLVTGAAVLHTANIGVGALHVFTKVGSSVLVVTHLVLAALVLVTLIATGTMIGLAKPRVPDLQESPPAAVRT